MEILDFLAHPQISTPYVQIGFIIVLKKYDRVVWTRLLWLRTMTRGGLSLAQQYIFGFHKTAKNF
jgi:hypothetical protein